MEVRLSGSADELTKLLGAQPELDEFETTWVLERPEGSQTAYLQRLKKPRWNKSSPWFYSYGEGTRRPVPLDLVTLTGNEAQLNLAAVR